MFTEDQEVEAAIRRLESSAEVRLRVFGTSMMPTILPGARLRFERVDPSALRVGDVALLRREHHFVVHRVVALEGDAVVTRGDGVQADDAPVSANEILGRAIGVPLLRGAVPLMPRAANAANRFLGRVAPMASAVTRRARRIAGEVHRRHVERGPIAKLRRRHIEVLVRPLESRDLSLVPRYLRRRGVRPSEPVMTAWSAAADAIDGHEGTGRRFVVAVATDGTIVGSAQLVAGEASEEVMDLFVTRSYRGLGLARRLVARAIAASEQRGVSMITAQVRAEGPSARGIFESLGFVLSSQPARTATHLVLARGHS